MINVGTQRPVESTIEVPCDLCGVASGGVAVNAPFPSDGGATNTQKSPASTPSSDVGAEFVRGTAREAPSRTSPINRETSPLLTLDFQDSC